MPKCNQIITYVLICDLRTNVEIHKSDANIRCIKTWTQDPHEIIVETQMELNKDKLFF